MLLEPHTHNYSTQSPAVAVMNTLATLSDLPNELMQEIMDHIPPANTSITSLSMVSRSWNLYLRNFDSRRHRFACIHLRSENILRFLALLQSPYCSFRQEVQQLYIPWNLGDNARVAQEMIHSILSNPHIAHFPPTRPNHDHSKSRLMKIKKSVAKLLMPGVKECHIMNIICLFPNLEHLKVQLMAIRSSIPDFPAQPPISPALKSVSVVCNSSPPRSSGDDEYIPPEWKRFLKWVRSNGVYTIRNLYLTVVSSWNYRAAEMFINLQGTSLKHLHLGPGRSDPIPPHIRLDLDVSLDSLHLEIISAGMSTLAADIVSKISSNNIMIIGLDIEHALVRDAAEVDNLVRLAEALKTQEFTRLRRILVRVEYAGPRYNFEEAVQILRGMFPANLLTVERILYEKRHVVREPTDDCVRSFEVKE